MSQNRGGFRLDANTMGLDITKPAIADEQQPQSTAQSPSPLPSTAQPALTLTSLLPQLPFVKELESIRDAAMAGIRNLRKDTSAHDQCVAHTQPLATDHYRKQLQKLLQLCGDSGKIIYEMNNYFLERLYEIDDNCAGDSNAYQEVRLLTYQDWLDYLLRINYVIVENETCLESATLKKLEEFMQAARGEQQQSVEENHKLRKDLCAIIKLVQEAYHGNVWNTKDLCLETLTVNQLLGVKDCDCPLASESDKMNKNMESLIEEISTKHDEIIYLRSQLSALDGSVRTAQQKIIFKDECIAQLNQKLQAMQSLAEHKVDAQCGCSDEDDHEIDQTTLDATNRLFEGLADKDNELGDLFNMLNNELQEFIGFIHGNNNDMAIKYLRKLHVGYYQKVNSERSTAQQQLENLRCQLRNLDCSLDELKKLNVSEMFKTDDCDGKLVNALYHRLLAFDACAKEINNRYEALKSRNSDIVAERKDLQCRYNTERAINKKTERILCETAELLARLRQVPFSYHKIFNEDNDCNPFCEAIEEIFAELNESRQLRICPNDSKPSTPAHSINTTSTTTTTIAATTTTTTTTTIGTTTATTSV